MSGPGDLNLCLLWGSFPQNMAPPLWALSHFGNPGTRNTNQASSVLTLVLNVPNVFGQMSGYKVQTVWICILPLPQTNVGSL